MRQTRPRARSKWNLRDFMLEYFDLVSPIFLMCFSTTPSFKHVPIKPFKKASGSRTIAKVRTPLHQTCDLPAFYILICFICTVYVIA